MFRSLKPALVVAALATILAPVAARADDQPRDVSCSINVSHTINNGAPQVYARDFEVKAGETFYNDFGTSFRFKDFTASTRLDADGRTVVDFTYYNEVTTFDAVEFTASLSLFEENGTQASGRQAFYSSRLGASHRTNWVMSCARSK